MPQRVTITFICSLCSAETDQSEKMTAYQITGPGRPLNFDVCPACVEVGPFRDLLERGLREGRASTVTAAVDGGLVCPDCGRVCANATGLGKHRKQSHGVVSATEKMRAERGTGPVKCPNRGCEFGAADPGGLSSHQRFCEYPKPRGKVAAG